MSRPLPEAASAARAELPESAVTSFDRLAGALLASPSAPLGPLLRAQLPGTAGVRWLRTENLPPTAKPTALRPAQWLSLFECWLSSQRTPGPQAPGARRAGRPATHGHAPGAMAVPRWGQ